MAFVTPCIVYYSWMTIEICTCSTPRKWSGLTKFPDRVHLFIKNNFLQTFELFEFITFLSFLFLAFPGQHDISNSKFPFILKYNTSIIMYSIHYTIVLYDCYDMCIFYYFPSVNR